MGGLSLLKSLRVSTLRRNESTYYRTTRSFVLLLLVGGATIVFTFLGMFLLSLDCPSCTVQKVKYSEEQRGGETIDLTSSKLRTQHKSTVFSLTSKEMAEFKASGNKSFNGLSHNVRMSPQLPLCTREQILDGRWVRDVLDRPPYITPTIHLRCPEHKEYVSGSWHTWKWSPRQSEVSVGSACIFTRWRSSLFCRTMKYGQVLIVGDSLSWEQYSSLVQLNGAKTHQGYQHRSKTLQTNIGQAICPQSLTRVVFRRDDRLQNLSSALFPRSVDMKGAFFPLVLILNRGAHYVEDDVLMPDIRRNLKEVEAWLQNCRLFGIKCHLFWRTSVPGHPHCWDHTFTTGSDEDSINNTVRGFREPVNRLSDMERYIQNRDLYDDRSVKYHWYDYQHQNGLVLEELDSWVAHWIDIGLVGNAVSLGKSRGTRDSPLSTFRVIDAYYLNVLRPDQHRVEEKDCLHSCYPGKMDVYNQLLLHYLQMDRTPQDVDRLKVVHEQQNWRTNLTTFYDRSYRSEKTP